MRLKITEKGKAAHQMMMLERGGLSGLDLWAAIYDEVIVLLLAEAERRGAEKALRDAADDLYSDDGPRHPLSAATWLRDRADWIARGRIVSAGATSEDAPTVRGGKEGADSTPAPSQATQLSGFACIHGDDGKQKMEALRAEVCAALECTTEGLVSAVVYELEAEFGVSITGIPCDQWAAVKSEHARFRGWDEFALWKEDPDGHPYPWEPDVSAYIQCDRIEDGFALTWKKWKEWAKANQEGAP
jgi:hypothetical protein